MTPHAERSAAVRRCPWACARPRRGVPAGVAGVAGRALPAGVATLAGLALLAALVAPPAAVALAAGVLERRGRRLRADGTGAPEVIVVLGAGLRGTAVTPVLDARLRAAAEAAFAVDAAGGTPLIVVSGGQGPDEVIAESAAMRRRLMELGVLPDLVVEEDAATSTWENLSHTRDVVSRERPAAAHGPWTVVTSAFHLPRTALLARRLGIAVRLVGAHSPRHRLPKALAREAAAVLTSRFRGE